MPAPRLTPELKRELHVLSLRSHVDRARKYKKGSEIQSGKWPKFFQVPKKFPFVLYWLLTVSFVKVANVVAGPADRYSHSRPAKKDRSKSIAQTLLADAQQRKYRKEKFMEIQRSRSSKRILHQQKKPRREKKQKTSKGDEE
jgi:hypothetical protein